MKVFNVVIESVDVSKDGRKERLYLDVIALNVNDVITELILNWEDYDLVSLSPSAGDIVTIAGGQIEMFGCLEPQEKNHSEN